MNEDEYNKEFNEKVYYSNTKYKLILKNNNNKYENNEENNALIYEILNTGNYSLEIINKNLFKQEEDYLYIKIQTSPFIDITNNDKNIKNLDFSQANKFDLSNGGMELKNCSCFNLSINNNNYPLQTPCACYLLKKYLLIDEILYYIIKICNYFSTNKAYDFTDILPMNDSIYKYYSYEYIKNPHLYYHYIETLKGFIVIIINKSKFNWNCDSIIEYSIEKNEYTAHFNFGRFKISYDLKLYDFDYRFKNILTKFNYLDSYLYLRQSTTIIEKLKYTNIDITNFLEKLAYNLEHSIINFINYEGSSCYQSSTLQGFVHIIFPEAIRNMIRKNSYKNLDNIDKFKNNYIFNDMIIDILKDINNLHEKSEGSNGYLADKLYQKFPPKIELHEGLENIVDSNILHNNLQNSSMKSCNLEYYFQSNKNENDLIIDINQNTIIADVMKIKLKKNENIQCYGNLVLELDENDIKDNNLNIIKLLKKCKQLSFKLLLVSDIIYMVIDRISNGKNITKQINLNEKIYFDDINKCFTEVERNQYLVYELKFIIYHLSFCHFTAYCKIENDWYYFDDLNHSFASKENPPLNTENQSGKYPVILYYVKKK